ncbi:MAG: site-specific DNA-methyltransferase [Alphaproteobacteria bacterium]|nr:site-specific DNA-methyltransferase [Alphaproteobacteria bacterium]
MKTATKPLSTWIVPNSENDADFGEAEVITAGLNTEGTKTLKAVFGHKAFNYPKPPSLIRELVRQASSPGDIVLDFFAGSGTTAQAVMELNAEDEGERAWILVSSTEATRDDPDRNLCRDVTAQRVARLNADTGKYADLAAEFAYLRTREIPFENLAYDLTGQQVWTIVQAMHGLALSPYDPGRAMQLAETSTGALAYLDRVTEDAVGALRDLSERGWALVVYAWAPGQVENALMGREAEVRAVPGDLTGSYR